MLTGTKTWRDCGGTYRAVKEISVLNKSTSPHTFSSFSDGLKVGVIGEKCIPAQQQHLLIIKRELTYGSNSDMGNVICKLSKKQRRYDLILAMVTENGELDTIPPVQSLW